MKFSPESDIHPMISPRNAFFKNSWKKNINPILKKSTQNLLSMFHPTSPSPIFLHLLKKDEAPVATIPEAWPTQDGRGSVKGHQALLRRDLAMRGTVMCGDALGEKTYVNISIDTYVYIHMYIYIYVHRYLDTCMPKYISKEVNVYWYICNILTIYIYAHRHNRTCFFLVVWKGNRTSGVWDCSCENCGLILWTKCSWYRGKILCTCKYIHIYIHRFT